MQLCFSCQMDHLYLLIFPIGPVIFCLVLAILAGWHQRSWARLFISMFLTVFWIAIPWFVFAVSSFLGPEWKGECPHGWIDCFIVGKLALTPLVLWASAAWYAVEIYQVKVQSRTHPWIVLGVFQGAVVSSICLVFGIVFVLGMAHKSHGIWLFLLVPLIIAAGHSIRAVELMRAAQLKGSACLVSLLLAAPFWFGSLIWSKRLFASLPDKAPDCFVVTAASGGHPALVGPFIVITRGGRRRTANLQLVNFWRFEELWQSRASGSHATFRRIYGRIGPVVSRCITNRWQADLVWLLLKPAELLARLVIGFVR